jgi:hypothetical protein
MSREQRGRKVVEWLQELTKNARAEYFPTFSMDDLVEEIVKAARGEAERGLYCLEYVFMPPSGSFEHKRLRTELLVRLGGLGTAARVYVPGPESGDLDPEIYEGVWVVCLSWRPATC